MATALTLLNNVLRGLRRDILESTSTTDAYQLLLIQFLNMAKDRLEEEWDWEALRTTVAVTLSASTQTYTLSASGPADYDVTSSARLLYERVNRVSGDRTEVSGKAYNAVPQVWDVTDSTEQRIQEITWEQFERLVNTDNADTSSYPQYFAIRNNGAYKQLGVWPMPTGTRTLNMRFVLPQTAIPNTFMTAYSLSIPARPVWLHALALAIEERGENVSGNLLPIIQREAANAEYLAVARERTDLDDLALPT